MARKIVHVIGTGTIGEPLIGLLCDFKEDLGIDEITFHKNTPLLLDRSKVTNLLKRGARLSTHKEKFEGFHELGLKPEFKNKEAIEITLYTDIALYTDITQKQKARPIKILKKTKS